MIKAIIFDMDGVLIDSEPVYLNQFIDFVKEGLNVTVDDSLEAEMKKCVGISDKELIQLLAELLKDQLTEKEINERNQKHWDNFSINYRTILNPHVLNILPNLKSFGLTLAIASSSPINNIKTVIEECGIQQYFSLLVSGESFKKSKPNPEIYLSTIQKLNLSADEVIVIEDSTYGIEAATKAGLQVIALEDHRFGFDQAKATYLVKDLLEAYQIIKNIMNKPQL